MWPVQLVNQSGQTIYFKKLLNSSISTLRIDVRYLKHIIFFRHSTVILTILFVFNNNEVISRLVIIYRVNGNTYTVPKKLTMAGFEPASPDPNSSALPIQPHGPRLIRS